MNAKENPVDSGASAKTDIANIQESEPAVKTSHNTNLIFFHKIFSDLEAEEYKSAMSAVALYAMDGTLPNFSGSLKVIFALAQARIDGSPTQRRRRGAPAGNKNACKNKSAEAQKQIKTIRQ